MQLCQSLIAPQTVLYSGKKEVITLQLFAFILFTRSLPLSSPLSLSLSLSYFTIMTCSFAGGFSNFSNKFPLLRLQQRQPDFSLKSLLQWENQVLSLKHTFLSSRFNLSKEEFIMYSIAVGFNGVPLVCFLAPLMTSSDPASYLMKKLIFPESPIIAMLAAAFFQGLTAFYASLLSLNLILICLTIVCEIGAVMRTSYPASEKLKTGKKSGGGNTTASGNNTVSTKEEQSANNKSESDSGELRATGGKVDNAKNSSSKAGESSKSSFSCNTRTKIQPEIRIEDYDKSDVFSLTGSEKINEYLQEVEEQVFHLENHNQPNLPHCALRHKEKSQNFKSESQNLVAQEQTSVFQVLSPKLDNQLQVPPPTSTTLPLHPTFGSASTTWVISSGKNNGSSPSNTTTNVTTAPSSTNGPSPNLSVPTSPMLMMKIMEELGPTVTVKPSSSSLVKKLMCPTPVQRIKTSAEVLFVKSFQLYLQTKLLVLFINDSMFYYFPVVIAVGMVLATLSGYATIKLHSLLPLPLRLSIFSIGLTIATVMLLLMMEATEITKHSDEFLRYWKKRLKRRFTRKQLRTCQSLRFKIGPFVDFKKDTIFGVFSTIQHHTVNLAVIQLVN